MKDLLLTNQTGARLYHDCAAHLPIIDFHCHLQPQEILEDKPFEDLGEIWLAYDHYKWRCMRTFGIDERLITGDAPYREKFMAFAKIMPMLAGNPVHIWCQLELARYFGITQPLGPDTAAEIYELTRAQILEKRMSPHYFINQSNVEYIATTDDPIDDLRYHRAIAHSGALKTKVAPALRPDLAMMPGAKGFPHYIAQLSAASGMAISDFDGLMQAIDARLGFFVEHGARVTDHGMQAMRYAESTGSERDKILTKALHGAALTSHEIDQYQTAFLLEMGGICCKHGCTMQLHFGVYRDGNTEMFTKIGANTGFDMPDDLSPVHDMALLINALNSRGALPRMILYPINSAQFEPFAILASSFCGAGMVGKVSLGAPWWFSDQPFGIKHQFEAVGQVYPLALGAGMVTDSRSFLSYPRHEIYRRALCQYLGELIERGEYIASEASVKALIEAVCYGNARDYFAL